MNIFYVEAEGGEFIHSMDMHGMLLAALPKEDAPEGVDIISPSDYQRLVIEGKRREAYEQEADCFRDQAISYEEEGKAWTEAGDAKRAEEALENARLARVEYLARKKEIRERYPDPDAERFLLNPTGMYHRSTCGYAGSAAQSVTLAELTPGAKPCSRCNPPTVAPE